MTGGMAFVYDEDNTFDKFVNSTPVIMADSTNRLDKSFIRNIKDYFSGN